MPPSRSPKRAPQESGGRLIEPAVEAIEPLLDNNRILRASFDTRVGDLRLWELIAATRRELLSVAFEYTASYRDVDRPDDMADWIARPIVMGGHQPQLFHPGVWLKNFVASDYAARLGGTAINLVVDTDRCVGTTVGVPVADGPGIDLATTRSVPVPFDAAAPDMAWEERGVIDPECLAAFGTRVCSLLRPLVPDPILRRWWPLVVERAGESHRLGLAIAQARHILEAAFGGDSLELQVSEMVKLPTVMVFTGYLLAHARELHEAYNASLAAYRRRHRQRSPGRPMPDLVCQASGAASGDASGEGGSAWYEVPWWIWSKDDPRRRRVHAQFSPSGNLTLSDLQTLRIELPISPDTSPSRWVDALSRLEEHQVQLRPRALVTTLIARVLMADVFVHGIGGAAYDEITDDIVRRLTGCDPPRHAVASGTLRLPLDIGPDPRIGLAEDHRLLREMQFHPEKHLAPIEMQPAAVQDLVARKRQWIDTFPTTALARRRCHEIRAANEGLAAFLGGRRAEILAHHSALASHVQGWRTLASREFPWCFFHEKQLKPFLLLENVEKIA